MLVIDTSLQGLTLGLAKLDEASREYEILEIYGSSHPQEAATRLPELCDSLLQKRALRIKDLDGLLVSPGPGSFTGIKIGLSFASGWKRAGTPTKIWAVSSFKSLLKGRAGAKALFLPATQSAGYFAKRGASSEPEVGVIDLGLPTFASLFDEASQSFKAIDPGELSAVEILGPWPRVQDFLSLHKIEWNTIDASLLHEAVVAGMIEEFIAKSHELSEGNLMPIYLRKSAPEEKLERG